MSQYPQNRYSSSHHHQPSLPVAAVQSGSLSASQTSFLLNRIEEKKKELQHLTALRDISGQLALQMKEFEKKLQTLADGTGAVADVLSNWQNVLRAVGMASVLLPKSRMEGEGDPFSEGEQPEEDPFQGFPRNEDDLPMPHTLVRLPAPDGRK